MSHVDKNGRCTGPGRAVRPYVPQRRPKQYGQRALPMELQCHPLALTRRPLHPHCAAKKPGAYRSLVISQAGRLPELELFGRWRVIVDGTTYGFTDSADTAMGCKRAAHRLGASIDVVDMGE